MRRQAARDGRRLLRPAALRHQHHLQHVHGHHLTTAGSVASEDSHRLPGTTGCGDTVVSSRQYRTGHECADKLRETAAAFLRFATLRINTTFNTSTATIRNSCAIYDYVHCHRPKRTLYSADLHTPDAVHRLPIQADQHERGLAYSVSDTVRAVAGAVLAAQVFQPLNVAFRVSVRAAGLRPGRLAWC